MDLSSLKPPEGAHRKPKRVGRGPGSGLGKTSGRGHKGQYSRSGSKRRPGREGGQMPLFRRLPKRGFFSPFRVEYSVVNLADLAAIEATDRVDIAKLQELKLVRNRRRPVKVLGEGTIDRPVHVAAHAFSKSAEEKITAAGGTCERIAFRRADKAAASADTAAPAADNA
jgi:large subunit ribosomal protein L15